nr:MAG TPA: hypothetical protein [Caudoviricetes sp.]
MRSRSSSGSGGLGWCVRNSSSSTSHRDAIQWPSDRM